MSNINQNYNLLITKLDAFIRKYYTNKLIRGLLFTTALVLAAFLVISVTEYFLYFSTSVRKLLFYSFLALAGVTSVAWIIVPLLQMFRLGKVISHQQAAGIIGKHFIGVQDKLLNILQLKHQADTNLSDASLIVASINQKADEIKLVPFVNAINLSKNKQYLKYALPPLALLIGLLIGAPNIIRDSSFRLFNNDREFERPAPFRFVLPQNQKLEAVQYDDLTVTVQIEGNVLPNEAFIHINNFPYKLKKIAPNEFSYTFNKLMKDTPFFLEAGEVRSSDYHVKVFPKPSIVGFDAIVQYPTYTGRKNETLKNSGDMVVPEGTRVLWNFQANHTDNLAIRFGEKGAKMNTKAVNGSIFSTSTTFKKDMSYTIFLSNARVQQADSMTYNVSVIPDQYPTITAEEKRDSGDLKTIYFLGDAADDYGISNLVMRYKMSNAKSDSLQKNVKDDANDYLKMPVSGFTKGKKATSFTFTWDVVPLQLRPGDHLNYFFEVWDNDAVNGSKSARTQMFSYEMPTIQEMKAQTAQNNEQMKDNMEKIVKDTEKIQKEIEEIKEKLIEKKDLNWDDKNKIQDLLNKHKDLEQRIEDMKKQFDQNQKQEEEYKKVNEEIQNKQEQLEKMLEELMSPEMKELMEKLEKLLEEMRKDDAMNQLENFEMNNEQMKMDMERMMQLFKQLEYEQKIEETMQNLEELAKQEEQLAKETEQQPEGSNMQQQQEKQKDIQQQFDDLKNDLKDIDKQGKELGRQEEFNKETQDEQQDAKQDMEQSQEEMKKGDSKGASKKQQSASQKMKQMKKKMEKMFGDMKQKQIEMDMKAIRQLLENLVDLSMDQEDLIDQVKATDINTPEYIRLMKEQYKLKDDMQIIEDSLTTLSKRVFELESFITKELGEVKRNMGDALDHFEARKLRDLQVNQQYVMTGANNLALMLSEAMQQMQQQMAMQMPGSQMCQKPGNSPGMKGMSQMQKQLNDQIAKMQQQAKDGKKSGGKDGKSGQDGMSKEAAQMAAKQAALRQALEKMEQERSKDGKKTDDLKDITKEMDKTETELVNKQITAEMLKRQQEILNRMLKAEQAEREQDQDDKRESKTAYERVKKIPPEILEYQKKQQAQTDLYKTVPPSLKPYYKDLVDRYFKSIGF